MKYSALAFYLLAGTVQAQTPPCSSEELYIAKDYEKARLCALEEHKAGGPEYGGPAILMMLYANGYGVERDIDRALTYAREIKAAPAEMEGRLAHLESMKNQQTPVPEFDLCQDITSGYMMGVCAAHSKKLQPKAPIPEPLQEPSRAFIEARTRNEIDLSGSARAALVLQEETIQEKDLAQMLELYSKGQQNVYSAKDLRIRETAMNDHLKRIGKSKGGWGTVTASGILATQKAWEKYRDAFAAFAVKQFKDKNEISARAWLTAKRNRMLGAYR